MTDSIRTNIKDYSIQDFQNALWQYVEDEMNKDLKSGIFDVKLVRALVNYRGNSYGARAMLLDMGFADLYEDIQDLIRAYADAHGDFHGDFSSYSCFEVDMADYINTGKTKKAITDEIRSNPLIKRLSENGHSTFANKAVRLLADDDERTKSANKHQREAMYNMRAEKFFKVLEKVVKELGE